MISSALRWLASKTTTTNVNGSILTILAGCIILFLLTNTTSNARLAPLTIVAYSALLILTIVNWKHSNNLRKGVALCCILSIYALILGLLDFTYLDKFLFTTLMLLLTITVYSTIRAKPSFINIISLFSGAMLIYFFAQSFGYFDTYYATVTPDGQSLLNNPNGMGLIMLISFILFDRGQISKLWFIRLVFITLTLVAMLNYESRSVLLCLAIYLAIVTLVSTKLSSAFRKWTFFTVVLFGILFPPLYTATYNSSSVNQSSAEVFGKKVYSGRQELWSDAMQIQNGNILIGIPNNNFLDRLPSESVHNSYLNISLQLGMPFMLSFLAIIYVCVIKNNRLSNKTFVSIIIMLFYSSFETVLESGNANAMLMLLTFINMDASESKALVG